ncbi:MAG: AhpC/TSA family protein [Prevotellaceae bacterium]|jgi:thiol-disulfide isomerase/thioredoxin|nr:AhpC/TSA family protein [Prevotellaceae bacterium]
MKTTTAVISVLAMAAAGCASAPSGYVVEGTIAGVDNGKVLLQADAQLEPFSDTTELKNGKFTFTGTISTPQNVLLYVDGVEGGAVEFFLVNDKITIDGDITAMRSAKVAGPPIVLDARRLSKQSDSLIMGAMPSYPPDFFDVLEDPEAPAELKAERQVLYDQTMELLLAASAESQKLYAAYVRKNPYSPLTVWIIANTLSNYPPAELTAILDSLKKQPELEGNYFLAWITEYVDNLQGIELGKIAPDFTQNTPDGTPLTFSTVYRQNKLTMVDFWASWCGPCRRFNPALVELYNQYHAKGFEIIGVSCDEEKEEWLKAIASDKLPWHHVSDLQKWNNAVARQFNVLSIPQNLFVNAEGVIVGIKIEEESLEKFLKEQLN